MLGCILLGFFWRTTQNVTPELESQFAAAMVIEAFRNSRHMPPHILKAGLNRHPLGGGGGSTLGIISLREHVATVQTKVPYRCLEPRNQIPNCMHTPW